LRELVGRLGRGDTTDGFDLKYGTDTGGKIALWNFKIDSPNAVFGVKYQATGEEELAEAISFLDDHPQNLTFIDLGCGKGRALLVAARLGFKQVIGVEFAHELAGIARKNLGVMRIPNAAVVEADAAEYRFPDNDMVVYLYNPFSKEVMEKVLENLRESLGKRLYVIYKVPDCAEIFDKSGFLIRMGGPPTRPYIQIWKAASSMPELDPRSSQHVD
jgi:SAM-dependent methyltransferase